ncbi:hypothetical protein B0H21DRAFT_818628 [Amylocystis lapponica]|nr:hypothetical protein B0H21DRAFT_818628 [Amylocystis lapponica]
MITNATAPFNKPNADAIIRSSDNVDFRVHKLILAEASPIFEATFSIPQPLVPGPSDVEEGLSVMTVSEDSKTLDTLLRMCYPSTLDPEMDGLDQIRLILCAADKYEMEKARAQCIKLLMSEKILHKDPFDVFTLAYHLRLKEETLKAARATLALVELPISSPPIGLESMPATVLFALMNYRRRCQVAVAAAMDDFGWRGYTIPAHQRTQ